MTNQASSLVGESSLRLISLVVEHQDRYALDELLSKRKLFIFAGRRILLPEFIWQLRQRSHSSRSIGISSDDIPDEAYDLTLQKFISLHSTANRGEVAKSNEGSSQLKQKQTDCRYYYGVVLEKMDRWQTENPGADGLEEEQAVGEFLQQLVVRHFYLSRLEILRKMRPYAIRYGWKVGGRTINLWYPAEIPAKTFREWLQQQLPTISPHPTELRSRLQAAIDSHFFRDRFVSIDDLPEQPGATPSIDIHDPLAAIAGPSMFAQVVAREKINHLNELRPAIRELGKKTLEQLILRIFSDLTDGIFEDGAIARDFGLSKATFSRFAGSKWQEKREGKKSRTIPDLWHNTAKVISADSLFLDAAREAGVLPAIARILEPDARKNSNE